MTLVDPFCSPQGVGATETDTDTEMELGTKRTSAFMTHEGVWDLASRAPSAA